MLKTNNIEIHLTKREAILEDLMTWQENYFLGTDGFPYTKFKTMKTLR